MEVAFSLLLCSLAWYVLRVVWRAQRILDAGRPLFDDWRAAIDRGDWDSCARIRARIVQIERDHNRYVIRHGLGWLAVPPTPRSPYSGTWSEN